MYFKFFKLHSWGQNIRQLPQTIYSEFPMYTVRQTGANPVRDRRRDVKRWICPVPQPDQKMRIPKSEKANRVPRYFYRDIRCREYKHLKGE